MYLLDTNVISELRRNNPHWAVLAWRKSVPLSHLAIPAVVIGEIQLGAEMTRRQSPEKAAEIEAWLERVVDYYTILPMGAEAFRDWGRLMVGKSTDLALDAMIAAIARTSGSVVVTRNVRDFQHFDVPIYDPFNFLPA